MRTSCSPSSADPLLERLRPQIELAAARRQVIAQPLSRQPGSHVGRGRDRVLPLARQMGGECGALLGVQSLQLRLGRPRNRQPADDCGHEARDDEARRRLRSR